MKKFVLKWGKGNVLEIKVIYKSMIVEAKSIDDINATIILPDSIKRKVFYVRNITDVGSVVGDADEGEDKIELRANEQNMHPLELVDLNIKGVWEGLDAVRCRRPNISPRATGHIVEIIEAVQKLYKQW